MYISIVIYSILFFLLLIGLIGTINVFVNYPDNRFVKEAYVFNLIGLLICLALYTYIYLYL